jgi:eukaryotic-like serine/threonine-protein kinase
VAQLPIGARVAVYEITGVLGAGGMGEVYRARDTRLDRTVAIKVLTGGLAQDAERRERFQREARAISALNHPNICVLHDIGQTESGGAALDYLVMEYIDGETLAARLERAPLTLDDALTFAVQIAAALDRAHSLGIVHRDLKPGNVMIAKGVVKLLDFGLARFTWGDGAEERAGAPAMVTIADLSMPTMNSPLTMKGTILGTLHYMAPEQLEGTAVDARADIFAFGAVLYEMLTRRRPFEGRSQASLIGAILDHQPPAVTTLQPAAPPLVDAVVSRCLAKSPDDRWQSMRDLWRQLEWMATHRASGIGAAPTASHAQVRRLARTTRITVASALLFAIATGVVIWRLWPQPAAPGAVARFAIDLPSDQTMTRSGRRAIAISSDGRSLAYVANQQLYLRAFSDLNAAAIVGTAGADPSEPVFSPDGAWIAFWSNGTLKKVPTTGGTPITLSDAQNPYGVSWEGERILLGQNDPRGIVSVPANGGAPTPLVLVDQEAGEIAQSPQLVADGRAVLFTLRTGTQAWDDASIVVQDLASNQRTVLIKGGTDGRLLPTGHLIYARQLTLFAVAVDQASWSVVGSPSPVQQAVEFATAGFSGAAQAAWSANGTLVFVPTGVLGNRSLAWLDRSGRVEPAAAPPRRYQTAGPNQMRISPDGSRVAVTVATHGDNSEARAGIWLWEIARGTLTALSETEITDAAEPTWSRDSRRVCYRSASTSVLCQSADGTGRPETVFRGRVPAIGPLTPDGKQIVVFSSGAQRSADFSDDINLAALGASGAPQRLVPTTGQQNEAVFSPDGRWMAYSSASQVLVRPFPNVDAGRWQITAGSALVPRWSADGRELFYLDFAGTQGAAAPRAIMAVPISPSAGFEYGPAREVVKLPAGAGRSYDVARDGRFLISVPATAEGKLLVQTQFIVVQSWFEEVRARVPR